MSIADELRAIILSDGPPTDHNAILVSPDTLLRAAEALEQSDRFVVHMSREVKALSRAIDELAVRL